MSSCGERKRKKNIIIINIIIGTRKISLRFKSIHKIDAGVKMYLI